MQCREWFFEEGKNGWKNCILQRNHLCQGFTKEPFFVAHETFSFCQEIRGKNWVMKSWVPNRRPNSSANSKKIRAENSNLEKIWNFAHKLNLRNIKNRSLRSRFCRRLLDYLMLWNWLIKSAFSMTFLWWTLKIATNILTFGLFFTASYHTVESLSRRIETGTFKSHKFKATSHRQMNIYQKWY